MTREDALKLHHGQIIYDRWHTNADGTPARWRVNGKVKTWKTSPRIYVPIKHGLRDYDAITLDNAARFSLTEEGAQE